MVHSWFYVCLWWGQSVKALVTSASARLWVWCHPCVMCSQTSRCLWPTICGIHASEQLCLFPYRLLHTASA